MGFLLPNTGLKDASSFADKIRTIIKKQAFTDKGWHSLALTVSARVAEYADSDSFEFEEIPGGGKQLNSIIFTRAIRFLKRRSLKDGIALNKSNYGKLQRQKGIEKCQALRRCKDIEVIGH